VDAFARLVDIMARLRGPGGCPWDAEQTHETLRKYLAEECYEALDAIDAADDARLAEELGDVLLQIVFHARLAEERGAFDIVGVCTRICDKLVRRHPHVFGEVQVSGPAEVLRNWEAIKRHEREEGEQSSSVLAGVPRSLPSLSRAQAIQKKAASVGFDWDDVAGPMLKVREETEELSIAVEQGDAGRAREELGDLIFAAVNVARLLNLDADDALRRTVLKFEERFQFIEQSAMLDGRSVQSMTVHEMDALWERAKAHEAERRGGS